jgi:hypothetical protein
VNSLWTRAATSSNLEILAVWQAIRGKSDN